MTVETRQNHKEYQGLEEPGIIFFNKLLSMLNINKETL